METYFEDVERLALAALLGGLIGLEREMKGKEAGLRTVMLVSLGAALFTIVSYRMSFELTGKVEDYTRIASYIVSGIGFLCAGLIFKAENGIKGLTTAASVWAATAIGMAVGCGLYIIAIGSTGLCIVILLIIDVLEKYLKKKKLQQTYYLKTKEKISEDLLMSGYLTQSKLALQRFEALRENDMNEFRITVSGPQLHHEALVKNLLANPDIISLQY